MSETKIDVTAVKEKILAPMGEYLAEVVKWREQMDIFIGKNAKMLSELADLHNRYEAAVQNTVGNLRATIETFPAQEKKGTYKLGNDFAVTFVNTDVVDIAMVQGVYPKILTVPGVVKTIDKDGFLANIAGAPKQHAAALLECIKHVPMTPRISKPSSPAAGILACL